MATNTEQELITQTALDYYEYLHLVRTRDGWKIANVLFQSR